MFNCAVQHTELQKHYSKAPAGSGPLQNPTTDAIGQIHCKIFGPPAPCFRD